MSSSKSSNKTTNNFYDQRQVIDAGSGAVGTGNRVDNSVTMVTTDAGAIAAGQKIATGAIAAGQKIAADAIKANTTVTTDALDFAASSQARAATFNERALERAFDLAKSSQAQAFNSSAEAVGAVMAAWQQSADSKDGNRTLILAGIGAVAAVAAAVAFR